MALRAHLVGGLVRSLLVEAGGIEPPSGNLQPERLRAYLPFFSRLQRLPGEGFPGDQPHEISPPLPRAREIRPARFPTPLPALRA